MGGLRPGRTARLSCALLFAALALGACKDGKKKQGEPALLGLQATPSSIYLTRAGEQATLEVLALRDGAVAEAPGDGLAFLSLDGAVASVGPDGLVTALDDGATAIRVSLGDVATEVPVTVRLDRAPPPRPEVPTWLERTNLRVQTWYGRTEPGATLAIAGAAESVEVLADDEGRFDAVLPLVRGAMNPVTVVVTDANGNASEPYAFPILQDDTLPDAGALDAADGEDQRGFAGETLMRALVVRATGEGGAPLARTEVVFQVVDGAGALSATGDGGWVEAAEGAGELAVATDSEGYARAWWRLAPQPGLRNTVYARLPGDSGLPVVFSAESVARLAGPTTLEGRVVNEHRQPLGGIRVQLVDSGLGTSTDALGRFAIRFPTAPPAPFEDRLLVDGAEPQSGVAHTRLTFTVSILPGQRNRVVRPFYTPTLPEGVALPLDANGVMTEGVVLERALGPGEPPTRLLVPKGTKVTWPPGLPAAAQRLTLLDIPVNRTPMPLPDGLYSRHILSVQPGGTRFDPPLPLDLPNLDGLAPGETVPLMSFDHGAGRFVPVGTATVTADGSRVRSDPGSGILVAAWHGGPPPEPPPKCKATGKVGNGTPGPAPPKPDEDCKCTLKGKTVPCPPKKKFEIPNVPCTTTKTKGPGGDEKAEPEPEDKVEVECEKEKKPLRIVRPSRKILTVRLGDTVAFEARCQEPSEDAAITWGFEGGEPSGTGGPLTSAKFPEEGRFTVTASAATEKCEGSDSVVIDVTECVTAGTVRVCGDQIDEQSTQKWKVSGNVTIGRGQEQFLRVGGAVDVDGTAPSVKGSGTWTMDTALAGVSLPNVTLWKGDFSIDGATGKVALMAPTFGDQAEDGVALTLQLTGFGLRTGGDTTLTTDGVAFATPQVEMGFGKLIKKDAANEVKVLLNEIAVRTGGMIVGGEFSWEGEIGVKVAKIVKILVGYQPSTDTLKGALGIKFGPPLRTVTLEGSALYSQGLFTELRLNAKFSQVFPSPFGPPLETKEYPGLPIPPSSPTSPIVLLSIDMGVKNPGYFLGKTASPPVFDGKVALNLGPAISVGSGWYASLGSGTVGGSIQLDPTKIKLEGQWSLLSRLQIGSGFGGDGAVHTQGVIGLAKATMDVTASLQPLALDVGGSYSVGEGLIAAFCAGEATCPFTDFGNVIRGELRGQISGENNNILGNLALTATVNTPPFKFGPVSVPSHTLAGLTGRFGIKASIGFYYMQINGYVSMPVLGRSEFTATLDALAPQAFTFRICHDGRCVGSVELDRFLFEGEAAVEVPPGLSAVEIGLTHEGGVQADLMTPEGELLAWDELHTGADGELRAVFLQDLEPGRSTWLLYDPAPGLYELVGVDPIANAREVVLAVPDEMASFAFAEPFERDGDTVRVAFSGSDGDSDPRVQIGFDPTPEGRATTPIADFLLSEAPDEVAWDTSSVAPGAYFVQAVITDGDVPVRQVTSRGVVVVEPADDPGVPRLVRAAPVAGGLDVSWVAPEGGASHYALRVAPRDGGEALDVSLPDERTRAVVDGLVPGGLYDVTVVAVAEDGSAGDATAPLAAEAGGGSAVRVVSEPPAFARAARTWTYAAQTADGPVAAVNVAEGPAGMAAAGGVVTWTPADGDAGAHPVTLTFPDPAGGPAAVQRLDLAVVTEAALVPPQILGEPPLDAAVGEPWAWTVEAATPGPADPEGEATLAVALVDGPAGMTLDGSALAWTPTAAEAVAARGFVPFTVRVTDGDGLEATLTRVLRFADADGDGLPTAWEVASGLDPWVADDGTADPDGDGRTHAQEAAAGTLGDVADTDGDGLDDGAEAAGKGDPRVADTDGDGLDDGAEAAAGSDPTLADTDGDGVSDADEVAQSTDPAEAPVDSDGDGLSDDLEQALGLDPAQADGDGDGCDDARERELGTSAFAADTDGDGAQDCAEADAGTDPRRASGDSDEDGLSDDLEVVIGTSPWARDTDGDGYEDGIERLLGFDPLAADSAPTFDPGTPNALVRRTGESKPQVLPDFQVTDVGTILVVQDDDLDGAPNDFELTWGYLPDDPSDGPSDKDGDGLPLWQEFLFGTSPNEADSDGDGVPDGQEVQDGTDPQDPESFVTGGGVVSLVVLPGKAALTSNTVFGPARLQLSVLGVRESGDTADLTPAAKGTTYAVADPGLGSVSADGLFTAAPGAEGATTLTVTNLGLTAEVPVSVALFEPKVLASIPVPGDPGPLAVSGDLLVMGLGPALQVVDVSVPAAPALGASLPLPEPVAGIALRQGVAAVAAGASGLLLVDVGDPAAPVAFARVPLEAPARGVALMGPGAYVATDAGLHVVDLGLPGGMSLVDANGDGRDDRVVAVLDAARAFVAVRAAVGRLAAGAADGTVVGVTVPGGPATAGVTATTQVPAPLRDLAAAGTLAFTAGGTAAAEVGLGGSPGVLSSATGVAADRIASRGDIVLGGIQAISGSLILMQRTEVAGLVNVGNLSHATFYYRGLAAEDGYHFVSGTGPGGSWLEVGQHEEVSDVLGVPPGVTLAEPKASKPQEEGRFIPFTVTAKDDVKVAEVTLLVDGEPQAVLTEPPYTALVRLPNVSADTAVTLEAEAVDLGGNVGVMDPVTLTVFPVVDTQPPTAGFVAPLPGEPVGGGLPVPAALSIVDDHAIWQVDFYLDGELVASADRPPFSALVPIPEDPPSDAGDMVIEAVVTDLGDNEVTASVTVVHGGVDLVAAGVTSIAADDTSWDGQRVLVKGGTVAMAGAHAFSALFVAHTGVLTHPLTENTPAAGPPYAVEVTTPRLEIRKGGAIDTTGRGYLGDCTPTDSGCGGGGHTGGNNANGSGQYAGGSHGGPGGGQKAAAVFGDPLAADQPGGGGGYGASGSEPGGNGGGQVRVSAGLLRVDGAIRSDGARPAAAGGARGGAGAGGAVWIDADTLAGQGEITALGGASRAPEGGAGGGGRVVVAYGDASGFDLGRVRAHGGAAASAPGAAGTVLLAPDGGVAQLVVDDGGLSGGLDDPTLAPLAGDQPLTLDADLVVRGTARLVLTTPLEVRDLRLEDQATLTHLQSRPGLEGGLDVTALAVSVAPGAAVDVTGRGYFGDCQPGDSGCGAGGHTLGNTDGGAGQYAGGSHGGPGGGAKASFVFGDLLAPATLGGGGGYGASGSEPGGDGGGRIRLVAESLALDGAVRADGAPPSEAAGARGGAGAGGSVWIEVGTLAGAGAVTALGGTSLQPEGGAGGGGRVAVAFGDASGFDLSDIRAHGGAAESAPGAPGTVLLQPAGDLATLVVDDAGLSGGLDDPTLAPLAGSDPLVLDARLVLRGGTRLVVTTPLDVPELVLEDEAVLTHPQTTPQAEAFLDLVAGAVSVAAGAAIDVTGRGYIGDCAPFDPSCGGGGHTAGNAGNGSGQRSGGSHGGVGGGAKPAAIYGDPAAPATPGGGGGFGQSGSEPGGDGGGRLRLVAGTLLLDGALRADGLPPGSGQGAQGGGGAGGSVWVTVGSLDGAGAITAAGGPALVAEGAGGGGGRVALEYGAAGAFDLDRVRAPGGAAEALPGAPGTVRLAPDGQAPTYVVDDGGTSGLLDTAGFSPAAGADPLDLGANLTVRGTTRLVLTSPLTVLDLHLQDAAVLTHPQTTAQAEASLTLTADTVTVDAGAAIDVSGRGYVGDCTPFDPSCGGGGHTVGNAGNGAAQRTGGSHGGRGGRAPYAAVFGAWAQPATPGGGGGYGQSGSFPGGDGGGVLTLTADALVLDGALRADGLPVPAGSDAGGGAGGAIALDVGSLGGAGAITARGGASAGEQGASGGGGRIAVRYASLQGFDLDAIEAHGGDGPGARGAPGTVWLMPQGGSPTLRVDDAGLSGGTDAPVLGGVASEEALELAAHLVLRGQSRVVLTRPTTALDVTLLDGTVLTHPPTTPTFEADLVLTADAVTVAEGAAIDVSGRGYLGDCGPGDPACGGGGHTFGNAGNGALQRAGGGHGGRGGAGGSAPPAWIYGDPLAARTLGAGGGYGASGGQAGGQGGGRAWITASSLLLNGALRADGAPGATGAGGGAGGSVRLDVGTLGGAGLVSAVGAPGVDDGAGGGGGRVAVVFAAPDPASPLSPDAVDAAGGEGAGGSGGPGTVAWLEAGEPALVRVANGGLDHAWEATPWLAVGARVATDVGPSSLTVASAGWIPGTLAGLEVVVDGAAGAFTVLDNTADTLLTDPADGDLTAIAAPGALFRGERTLDATLEIAGGARVVLLDRLVVADLLVGPGGVLTHPARPGAGPDAVGLDLDVTGTLTVAALGAIDVSARGYAGDCGAGDPSCGNGGGTLGSAGGGGAQQRSGGSHGGLGGGAAPGVTYGDPLAPATLGGGGGYGDSAGDPGARGGGRLRVLAGAAALLGQVLADGSPAGAAGSAGGGAGGSIWIDAGALTGDGLVRAAGGAGGAGPFGAGGGGGRVRLVAPTAASFPGTASAPGGAGPTADRDGQAGTVEAGAP